MSTFAERQLRTMALADLNPAPYNPRDRLSPESEQYKMLRESLLTYGNVQPVVVNVRDGRNVIVGGHQRYWILHEDLGYAEDTVVIVDVSEDMEVALNLALNKAAGMDDVERLVSMIERAESANIRQLTQYTEDDYHMIAESLHASDDFAATDFLNFEEDLEKTIATKATVGAAELKEDHPHRTGEQLFTMQMVFTGEQRETVMAAITAAKEAYALGTTMEAIVAICQQFLIDQGMG